MANFRPPTHPLVSTWLLNAPLLGAQLAKLARTQKVPIAGQVELEKTCHDVDANVLVDQPKKLDKPVVTLTNCW